MGNIKKISIVCSTGAETYQVGETINGKSISKKERVAAFEDAEGVFYPGWFLVKGENDDCVAEINGNAPYVIEFA